MARLLPFRAEAHGYPYRRSERRPADIPSRPDWVYASEWVGLGDWLGTGAVATAKRGYRPFGEARAFVHALGLKNQKEWKTYCLSWNKAKDIPNQPRGVYSSEWQGIGDWLGTGRISPNRDRQWRPFAEARAFVRSLGLKNYEEWRTYHRSAHRPKDIPSTPRKICASEWLGFADWLGVTNLWTKPALLAFLDGLRPILPRLREDELYLVLQQGGQWPALRAALGGAPPLVILRDLQETGGQALRRAIVEAGEDDVGVKAEAYLDDETVSNQADVAVLPAGETFGHDVPQSGPADVQFWSRLRKTSRGSMISPISTMAATKKRWVVPGVARTVRPIRRTLP